MEIKKEFDGHDWTGFVRFYVLWSDNITQYNVAEWFFLVLIVPQLAHHLTPAKHR